MRSCVLTVRAQSFFNYDGFSVVTGNTIRNVIAAAVAVFIVMLILLASIPAASLVLLMVALCDVGLFGTCGVQP